MAEFGPIVTSHDVERAVLNTLRTWIDSYLTEIERRREDLFTRQIGRPLAFQTTSELRELREKGRLPAIVVECAAMADPPDLQGDGTLNGTWDATVIPVVKTGSRAKVRRDLSVYEAAIRTLLAQKADLGNFASGLELGASRYDAVSSLRDETLAGAEIPIVVYVDAIGRKYGGPEIPDDPAPTNPPDESPTDPLHTSTHVTVT